MSRPSDDVNMSMKENPVDDIDAAAKSSVAKSTASSIPKPKAPLAAVENHILNGMTEAAFSISSAMWSAPSTPKAANISKPFEHF